MPGRLYTGEEKYNIIMESFQNPNIAIAEICREHGIAVSLFYKWKEQFLERGKRAWEEMLLTGLSLKKLKILNQ